MSDKEKSDKMLNLIADFMREHNLFINSYDNYNGDDNFVGADYYIESEDRSVYIHIRELEDIL